MRLIAQIVINLLKQAMKISAHSDYIPKHHCKIPDNSSKEQWILKNENGSFESCSMFVNSSVSNDTIDCIDGWEYDDEDCGITIVNEVMLF